MGRRTDPPWDEPGWREATEAWIRTALATCGRPITGSIEEVRVWSLSCVLRAPTSDGWVYFKEALDLPLFADEPRVTRRLAALYPDAMPEVLATDDARRWMLTSEAGEIIGWGAPEDQWVAPYAECARTQRDACQHVADLLAAECMERDIRGIPTQFDAVLNDTETMGLLDDTTVAGLADLRPQVATACEDLAAVGIPNTLVHGDLHVGNMALRDGRCVVIDWTDVCISHPFMDGLIPHRMEDAAAKELTRTAILDAWEGVAPPRELREAWRLSEVVCPAHHVVSYASIMAHMPLTMQDELAGDFENVATQLVDAAAADAGGARPDR